MRWGLLVIFALFSAAFAVDQQNLLILPCVQASSESKACDPSKADLKKAQSAFARALKLEKENHYDEAFREFDTAARLVPKNVNYVTALSVVREKLVFDDLERGNADLLNGKAVEAQAEFRGALNLDPQNEFAQQRLRESLNEWAPEPAIPQPLLVEDSGELHVVPDSVVADFHFTGNSRELLTAVAKVFGVSAEIDDSVVSRRVRFDIDRVGFYKAMQAACAVTGAFWTPLAQKEIFVLRENAENHRQFDHMALRTFYLPQASNVTDVSQIITLLRVVFDVRFIGQQLQAGSLEVRAPVPVLDAVTKTLEGLDRPRAQVMLDVHIYQIDHQLTRNMGLQIPDQFTLFNIPSSAIAALAATLGGQNIQSLINSLISGGGINQANSQAISSLLGQLQGQQNSIFSQPLATFGGGLTLMGLSLGTLGAQLSLNESWVKTLDHATLRAAQGLDTTFRIGSRYPILNASFAPVFNSSAISQVLQNGSFQAPFPSFTYEDLGLSIKAKPTISPNSDVSLQLEIEMRSLAGQSLNGVPVISNRQYKGSITLANGEPAAVAGYLTRNEQLTLTGIPGLGNVPGLNKISASNSKTDQTDELMVVITPHIVSQPESQSSEVWLPKGS